MGVVPVLAHWAKFWRPSGWVAGANEEKCGRVGRRKRLPHKAEGRRSVAGRADLPSLAGLDDGWALSQCWRTGLNSGALRAGWPREEKCRDESGHGRWEGAGGLAGGSACPTRRQAGRSFEARGSFAPGGAGLWSVVVPVLAHWAKVLRPSGWVVAASAGTNPGTADRGTRYYLRASKWTSTSVVTLTGLPALTGG